MKIKSNVALPNLASFIIFCILLINSISSNQLQAIETSTVSNEQLITAIKLNDQTAFEQALSNKPNFKDHFMGAHPLPFAAKLGRLKMLKQLHAAGADINQISVTGGTALMKAAYGGKRAVTEWLINNGADLRLEHPNGYEAFDWALETNQIEILIQLVHGIMRQYAVSDQDWVQYASGNRDAIPSTATPQPAVQSFALIATILNNDIQRLSVLLEKGFNPDLHNVTGYAALPLAVRLNHATLVDRLLSNSADVNLGNNGHDEASAINQAARGGNLLMLKKLIKAGADINKQNARGYAALHLASSRQALDCVTFLLSAGADPELANSEGFSSFDFAYQNGNKEIITEFLLVGLDKNSYQSARAYLSKQTSSIAEPLLKHPGLMLAAIVSGLADLDVGQPMYGYMPLNFAARFGNLEVVKQLIAQGAPVNRKAKTGYQTSPLMDTARQQQYVEIAKYLLDHHALIRQGDKNNDPVINWATYYGHTELIKLLLNRGADPLQSNKEGYTAIRTAKESNHPEILSLLQKHKEEQQMIDNVATAIGTKNVIPIIPRLNNINLYLPDGTTLLIKAIQKNQLDLVKTIIKKGANIELPSATGYLSSPLMQASLLDDISIAKLLLMSGANIEQKDRMGDTVLNWASYLGNQNLLQYLLEKGARTDVRTVHGNALEIAMRRGHQNLVYLLQNKRTKKPEAIEITQLFDAVQNKDVARLKMLTSSLNIKSAKNGYGDSILTFAANKHCIACTEILLQAGFNVDQTDSIGFTALMIAARDDDLSLLKLLLIWGAQVNTQAQANGMNITPLMLASSNNHVQIITILHQHGATLNITDAAGNTALDWAMGNSEYNKQSVDLLIKLGADN